jgi:hypothetical protein
MDEKQTQYDIVKGIGSDEELEKYRQCFLFNGSEKSMDNLKWMHQQNLRGLNSIYYGIDRESQEIAGIHAYLPVILTCMGKIVNGMQSFDTLTDKRHRSRGLFIKLATKVVKEESLKNNELVYAFPNDNSLPGYINKLGFTYFGEVPFLIKPFRISYFINKILKRREAYIPDSNCNILIPQQSGLNEHFEIKEISEFDEKYNELYNAVTPQINIGINRNAAFMNWRYIAKPGAIYARYGLYEQNQLTGVVVFTLKNKHGGKIGYVMELLYDPKNEKAGNYLLQFCSGTLKKNDADVVLAWCFDHSFNYACFRRNGYYKFPEKLRPQKLGFITKTLNSKNTKDIYNIKNWYLSYSDSDTV